MLIGSRTAERAQDAAEAVQAVASGTRVEGVDNAAAAARADVVVFVVPYAA